MENQEEVEGSNNNANKLLIEAVLARVEQMLRRQGDELHQRIDHLQGESRPRRNLERTENLDSDFQRQPRFNDHDDVSSLNESRRFKNQSDNDMKNMKLKIPPFHGKNDPDAYLEWEKKIEMIFDCQDYTDYKMVKLAATEFYGYALNWWDQVTTTRKRNRDPPIVTWDELKILLRKRFVPSHYQRELHQKLRRLIQGNSSVEDYFQEMESLMFKANIIEDDEATIARFLGGLNRDIQDRVEMQSYVNLEEIYHKANLIEQQLKRKGSKFAIGTSSTTTRFVKEEKAFAEPKEASKIATTHSDFKNKKEASTTTTRTREIICFKCQGRGHISSACPNKRVMILLKDGGYESAEEEELLDSPKSQEEYAVKGDLLMIHKILHMQEQVPDMKANTEVEAQRENLFQTRCFVQGKVCSFIIDGGSCTNVASEYMVKKLGLNVMKHPKPYDLHWLNDKGEMRVHHQVLVPFSIGKYEDEVLCDVLPMEASHILVGRPWQYDRRVLHDGSTNKYSFEHKGRKIILVPMTPSEIYQDKKKKGKQPENSPSKFSNFLARSGIIQRTLFSQSSTFKTAYKETLWSLSNDAPELPSGIHFDLQGQEDKGEKFQPLIKPLEVEKQSCIQFGQIEFTFSVQRTAKEFLFTNTNYTIKQPQKNQTLEEKDYFDLRTNLFQEGGDDVILSSFKHGAKDQLVAEEERKRNKGATVTKIKKGIGIWCKNFIKLARRSIC